MIDRKNRYGRTAARIHDADGLVNDFWSDAVARDDGLA